MLLHVFLGDGEGGRSPAICAIAVAKRSGNSTGRLGWS
jgi:hypothetical protein